MKKLLVSSILFLSITPALLANHVKCNSISAKKLGERNRMYTFSANTSCNISVAGAQMSGIQALFVQELQKKGNIEGASDLKSNNFKFVYSEKEAYNTGHGDIRIDFNSAISSNSNSLSYLADSKNIDADSYAANTQSVKIAIKYDLKSDSVNVNIEKKVVVEKPRFAPGFEDAAMNGLKKELSLIVEAQKNVLRNISPDDTSDDSNDEPISDEDGEEDL